MMMEDLQGIVSRFRYFALNTERRWYALQTGQVYVRQNLEDAQLTVEDLQSMAGDEADRFSNCVLCYGASLRDSTGFNKGHT